MLIARIMKNLDTLNSMEKLPTISVVVPCYNLATFLPESLDSILQQDYSEWECIIVDDGSTDNSAEIAKSYAEKDSRFRLLSIENGGVSRARNIGVEESLGSYILFLDADDIILPHYMSSAIAAFEADPSITLVYGRAERFGNQRSWDLPPFSMNTMLARNCLYISTFFRKLDFVPFDSTFKVGFEDWDFWLSVLEPIDEPKVVCLPNLCFRYRTRRHSRNTKVTDVVLDSVRYSLWEKHKALYAKYFCSPRETVEYKRLERSFKKASRWSILWKLRLLYRSIFS